ncbi:MAG: DUF2059 domain-containing protein [Spirochaetota bacterium]
MKKASIIALALLLVLASSALAQTADPAESIYRESGMEYELDRLATELAIQLEAMHEAGQMPPNMSEDDLAKIVDLVPQAFAESEMRDGIIQTFRDGLTEAETVEVLEWLRSETGRSFTRMEDAASERTTTEELVEETGGYDALDAERQELLARLDEAGGLTRNAVNVTIGIQLGILAGALGTIPMDAETFQNQLATSAEQLEAARPQLREALHGTLFDHMAVTYRDASNDELEAYVRLYESDAGRSYASVARRAIADAIFESAKRLGRMTATAFDSRDRTM